MKLNCSRPRLGNCFAVIAVLSVIVLTTACAHWTVERPAITTSTEPAATILEPENPFSVPPADQASQRVRDSHSLDDTGSLAVALSDAILMALENNVSFRIERFQPAIAATEEQAQRSVFDPVFSATVETNQVKDSVNDSTSAVATGDRESVGASAGTNLFLPFGTDVSISAGPENSTIYDSRDTETKILNWKAAVNQPLFRGGSSAANLALLRQARLESKMSVYELRGAAEALVSQVEQTVWEYVLAQRSIAIYEQSLEVARQQMEEVQERIRVGKLAETEIAAVEAEKANRFEQLINARAALLKKRLALIRLLNPSMDSRVWEKDVLIEEVPEMTPVKLENTEFYVESALKNRSDLNQARLAIDKGQIDIVRTKNGLLPKLDLFFHIDGSHYTHSFAAEEDVDGDTTTLTAGLNFELPYKNRQAKSRYKHAQYSLEQSRLAVKNMEQLIQVDVRSAYVEVKRMEEQINATRATHNARQKTLNMEQEKFRVGKSTTFLVSQAHRDLVESEIAKVEAIIEYRKALLNLYRLDGSLLQRKGIGTQGGTS